MTMHYFHRPAGVTTVFTLGATTATGCAKELVLSLKARPHSSRRNPRLVRLLQPVNQPVQRPYAPQGR